MTDLETRRNRNEARLKFRRRRIVFLLAIAAVLLVIIGVVNRSAIKDFVDNIGGSDYAGNGHGSITLVIHSGESGTVIAHEMVKLDIVKNYTKLYRLILERKQIFYAGTYRLKLQMSADSALTLLADPKSLLVNKVVIKEGLRIGQVFSALSNSTALPKSDFEAYLHKPSSLGVPSSEVSIEGWLFPATYSFAPNLSAKQILTQMVDRMKSELDTFGVSAADRHKVLTLASVIQTEARLAPDFYKVARVFTNRIRVGMPLQSDATVNYGVGGTKITTTDAARADQNGYNTYVHVGLPIGPIGAPGNRAIDAALHPASGTWLYFCTVNLVTGETEFNTTIAGHNLAVAKFRSWLAANPGWNG